ncbi:uncharacterized protein [Triticum aestivum]|uniref:uncharacterized protein n=1 Tax=Triticum aestivum TaxID=4565 RepID=UPI001D012523|nr:uncharacterized protein LOC123040529 [Triticum aestivum]
MQQGATAGSSPEAGLNVEYAGFEAHHIPNSSVFGAQHALEAKLLKFTNQQYACMVMNGQKFDLPDNIDRLRVDLCYRNDGSADSDVETGWNSRAAANIKLGETEIEVKKFVYAHWVKWVFKRDADVIIHYLSSGREKKASIIQEIRKEIEELKKTLALRKEELRKLEQDH